MPTASHRFARQHGLPFLSSSGLPDEWPTLLVPFDYWQRHGMLPLNLDEHRLSVAVASVGALRMTQELAFITRCHIVLHWCSDKTLAKGLLSLSKHHAIATSSRLPTTEDVLDDVRRMVASAHAQRASDIHLDPTSQGHQQRLRIDGRLQTTASWPLAHGERIIRQLKLLSSLDTAQTCLPQDGSMILSLSDGRQVDLRISTLPALHGEKVVMRFIPSDGSLGELAQCGLTEDLQEKLITAISRQTGMILVTGPTGSGKTSTLYRLMKAIPHRPHLNLCSVEDPVEARLHGVNQIQVNAARGLGFATILRALLRQDPDVMMVGEIRDSDTARMAIRAAQTGHLVMTTLHTGSAASALSRLHALGVPRYDLANAISLIVSQRLIRKLCAHCRIAHTPSPVIIERYPALSGARLLRAGPGCPHCRDGYTGRMALFEMAIMTPDTKEMLLSATNTSILSLPAATSLKASALEHLMAGETSLDEVLDVLQ